MGVFKRGAYWHFEFELDGERFRGSTKCKNKSDAQAFEAGVRVKALEAKRLGMEGRKTSTLGELAEAWLENVSFRMADHRNNQSRVRKLFGEELDRNTGESVAGKRAGLSRGLEVQRLSVALLTELKESRFREGNSEGTINRELALIQALFRYGHTKGIITPNIHFPDLYEEEEDGKLRFLTLDEEQKLIAGLKDRAADERAVYGQTHHDLAMILLDTGARLLEAADLRWSDVDVDKGLVRIRREKVGNESLIKVPARTQEVLARMAESRTGDFLFPAKDKDGRLLNRSIGHAVKGIRTVIDRVGLNDDEVKLRREGKVTVHTFRHTFATRLVQAGVDLYAVQRLLGHSSAAMTQRYAKLRVEQASEKAAAVLDAIHAAAPA